MQSPKRFSASCFLLAVNRVAPPKRAKRTRHPANAPPGFRLHTSGKVRRFLQLSGLHQGSHQSRIARLKRLLENIERWVTRFVKRLRDCTKRSRLVLTHAIADACATCAASPPAQPADTS